MQAQDIRQIKEQIAQVVDEWLDSGHLKQGHLVVVGCSTSEVAGERIGTSSDADIAKMLFRALSRLKTEAGVELAFQCCEHLNRSLVVEQETAEKKGYEPVSAIPIPKAGGAMASRAFKEFDSPVLVEHIAADAGLDIGETLIGMHLKPVAVPLRFQQKSVGDARITAARTRPKLIGGERAVYSEETTASSLRNQFR